jgi:hypothetical protein
MWVRSGLISSISASVGDESHEANFFQFFGGIKRGNAVLVGGRDLPVFDIKLFRPPTLY